MSGGVDSSVAAKRLLDQGYSVVGVFIKVWQPDFIVCNWEQERLDAMRVAAHLGIPFLTCDAEADYKQGVADYFISEYLAGRTPNPDVMCNQKVKFGSFMRFANAHGADAIATGHYVQKQVGAHGAELHRGIDVEKDQSYFLWTLSDEQLDYSLFPIGNTDKSSIRDEALAAGIPTAQKADSQGICFLGHVDIPDFLSHYTTLTSGAVLDTEGNVIGEHKGALVYTIGQRHGFTITVSHQSQQPHYIQSRDLENNTITVAPDKPIRTATTELKLESVTLRASAQLQVGDTIQFQTRYRQTPYEGKVVSQENHTLTITPRSHIEAVASGQSCVLYNGSHCFGGGIIS